MTKVYIGVGSNVEPQAHVVGALEFLKARMRISAISRFFTTAPIGRPDQEPYANGVFCVETSLEPQALKALLGSIEDALGRRRSEDRYAPRTIDLDLVLYGDRVICEPGLEVPDPDLLSRPFLAAALLEIAPDLIVPGLDKPLAELATFDPSELVVNSGLTEELIRRAHHE